MNAFLKRPLSGAWPYLWLDATYLKVREGGRIVSVAAIVAVAVDTEGRREIIGLHIGPSEAEVFWTDFLRDLVKRGLSGVQLVISDAHEGLKAAICRVLKATWQRCRFIGPATRSLMCRALSRPWSPPACATPSSSPTRRQPEPRSTIWLSSFTTVGRSSKASSMPRARTCSPT